jgi:hypothetical protein
LPTSKSLYEAQVEWKWKHTCIAYIVKSIQGSKEKDVILLDQDVHVCGIYMVAILILLCSLKHVSLVWNLENTIAREHGLSFFFIFLFFHGGHLSTHCFRFLRHLSIFSILFFCIATCLFLQLKNFKKDINKNLEHLFLTNFFLCLLLA